MSKGYDVHEGIYLKLKEEGAAGWGGQSLEMRLQGWRKLLQNFSRSSCFPQPRSRILEIGCGAGNLSEILLESGFEVSGVDISPTAIEWAKDRFEAKRLGGEFYTANVIQMPMFAAESFDGVVDGNCYHCILGEDRSKVLAEIRRVLKTGRPLILSSMVGEPLSLPDFLTYDSRSRCQLLKGQPYRYMATVRELRAEIQNAGFRIEAEILTDNPWWQNLQLLAVAL